MTGFVERPEVKDFCLRLKQQGKKIVFTNGCFDILHVGHIRYLSQARALGDFLFIGLNSDSSVRSLKGESRPIQTELDRSELLLALKCVDGLCVFSEETPLDLIKLVKPDVLVKGGDWPLEKIVGRDFVESYKGKVQCLPFVDGRSTTGLIKSIQKL